MVPRRYHSLHCFFLYRDRLSVTFGYGGYVVVSFLFVTFSPGINPPLRITLNHLPDDNTLPSRCLFRILLASVADIPIRPFK